MDESRTNALRQTSALYPKPRSLALLRLGLKKDAPARVPAGIGIMTATNTEGRRRHAADFESKRI